MKQKERALARSGPMRARHRAVGKGTCVAHAAPADAPPEDQPGLPYTHICCSATCPRASVYVSAHTHTHLFREFPVWLYPPKHPVRPSDMSRRVELKGLGGRPPLPPGLPAAWPPWRLASLAPGLPAPWPPWRLASLPPGLPATWPPWRLASLPPGLLVDNAKPTCSLEPSAKSRFSIELLAKPTFSTSWRPIRPLDGPAGSLDSLRRTSWRPRRSPDKHHEWVLQAPETVSGQAS